MSIQVHTGILCYWGKAHSASIIIRVHNSLRKEDVGKNMTRVYIQSIKPIYKVTSSLITLHNVIQSHSLRNRKK